MKGGECMDFSELTAEYLKSVRLMVSKQTYSQKGYQLKWFNKYLQSINKPFDKVNRSDIESYLLSIQHCKISTRRERVMVVRDFYTYIIRKYYPDLINPVHDIEFRNYKKAAVPVIPAESFFRERLQNEYSTDNEQNERKMRNRAMAELAYGSGLRRGELAVINIEDIDFESKRAYVCGKGGGTRIVPLTAATVDAVCNYIAARKHPAGRYL